MKVLFPTTSPPAILTLARSAHAPESSSVPHASVASSALIGTFAATFSRSSVVSNTSRSFPASAVIRKPTASSSFASIRVSSTCRGAWSSRRLVCEFTTAYVTGDGLAWSSIVSAVGFWSCTVSALSPLLLSNRTEPRSSESPSTSNLDVGAAVSL